MTAVNFDALIAQIAVQAPPAGFGIKPFVLLGQLGSASNLIDGVNYLLIRDSFRKSETWDTVIVHRRQGGSKIGKALFSEVSYQWTIYIYGSSNSYQSGLTKLQTIKDTLALAHSVANTNNPVLYIEDVADQTTLTNFVVLHGTCVETDRINVSAGIIKAQLDLIITPL